MNFNIITASHDDEILSKNLADSALFQKNHRTMVVKGYTNISDAYESANKICFSNEYNVFVHHDVFLPVAFEDNLKQSILELNAIDDNWGVIGVAGAVIENGKRIFYGNLKDRGSEWGTCKYLPHEVQTLDELILITKGDFIFDDQLDLHFYGADICMQAIREGRKNYAIYAYVHHNSTLKPGYRSQSFKECQARFKEKWASFLPITTTCALIQ